MTQTFSWAGMGKADYSQAHGIYGRLPHWIRRKLRNDEPEVLCRLIFLFWTCARRSGRGSAYAIPSEDYLASCIGKSVRTVRRCLTALKELRLISWTRRKGHGGEWLSNIYKPAFALMDTLFSAFGRKPQQNHHRTNLADNNLGKVYKPTPLPGSRAYSTRPKPQQTKVEEPTPSYHRPWKAPDWMTQR